MNQGVPLPRAWRTSRESTEAINETAPSERTPFEETLCEMAGRVLMRDYPGFHWAVRVNEATGMFYVLNQDLSGEWGYTGKIGEVFSATQFEAEVRKAGGGILEYFGVARAKADQEKLVVLPTDYAGRVLPAATSDRVFPSRKQHGRARND